MIFSIFYFLLIFLIVFGAVILFEALKAKVYRPKYDFQGEKTIFLRLKGHQEDLEYTMRRIIHDLKNENSSCEIICMDFGLDSETRKVCELFSRDFHFVKFVDFK